MKENGPGRRSILASIVDFLLYVRPLRFLIIAGVLIISPLSPRRALLRVNMVSWVGNEDWVNVRECAWILEGNSYVEMGVKRAGGEFWRGVF